MSDEGKDARVKISDRVKPLVREALAAAAVKRFRTNILVPTP